MKHHPTEAEFLAMIESTGPKGYVSASFGPGGVTKAEKMFICQECDKPTPEDMRYNGQNICKGCGSCA